MTDLHGFYLGGHESQYGATASAITRAAGCSWTAAATGIDNATAGKLNPSPDRVHSLVKSSEETSPATPGWSLPDVSLAAARLKASSGIDCGFVTGSGWTKLMGELDSGHYVLLQGDSDQFGNGTCSGAFNGDHCIGIHPATLSTPHGQQHWIDDPICPAGRWEFDDVLREYATKLDPGIRWGWFTVPVRKEAATLWAPDVPARIRALDPTGKKTATAFTKVGHQTPGGPFSFGSVIELSDIAAAYKRLRWVYAAPNAANVAVLLKWAAAH